MNLEILAQQGPVYRTDLPFVTLLGFFIFKQLFTLKTTILK